MFLLLFGLFCSGIFLFFFFFFRKFGQPIRLLSNVPEITANIHRNAFALNKIPKNVDVIVIGSGIGGLCAASLLSRQGYKVLVLEQHDVSGGCTHSFMEQGFEFDTGLHYIGGRVGKDSPERRLYDAITNGTLKWNTIDEAYDVCVYGENYEKFPMFKGKKLKEDLLAKFPNERDAIEKYFVFVRQALKASQSYFLLKFLPRFLEYYFGKWLNATFYSWAEKTTREVLLSLTKNEDLIGILTYIYGDHGLAPKDAPFVLHAIVANHYYVGGTNYPSGGSAEIAKGCCAVIASTGGAVLVRAPVSSIIVEDGIAKGVVVSKEEGDVEIRAPIVISAAGACNTFLKLIPESSKSLQVKSVSEKFQNMRSGIGHFTLFVGLEGSVAETNLPSSNYWVSPTLKHDENRDNWFKNIDNAINGLFISFPSSKDDTWAKRFPNKSVVLVVCECNYEWVAQWENTTHKKRSAEYDEMKMKMKARLLDHLFKVVPQCKGRVKYSDLGTPLSNNYYIGSYKGSSYGLEHNIERFKSDILHPQTDIPGLYLTGCDVTTCGVSGALIGGVAAAFNISKKSLWNDVSVVV